MALKFYYVQVWSMTAVVKSDGFSGALADFISKDSSSILSVAHLTVFVAKSQLVLIVGVRPFVCSVGPAQF